MNEKRFAIFNQIKLLKLDRENAISRIRCLKYRDESMRHKSNNQQEKLVPLQLALDKLTFNNNAYFDKHQIKSFEDDIPLQKLKFRVLHGSNCLAEERRLLKKTKKNEDREGYYSLIEELSHPIMHLTFRTQCYSNDESKRRKIIEELKEMKWQREKAIANATVNGRLWSSLEPKHIIQHKIKIIEEEVEATRKDHIALRAQIKLSEKNLKAIEKQLVYLQKQLTIANQRKATEYQCILQLRK
ncbi:hypothetical protein M5689_012319 [Euphorbia peplus]|nr:hypothetical protein M5689_012319 [Euphorbia peplus]